MVGLEPVSSLSRRNGGYVQEHVETEIQEL